MAREHLNRIWFFDMAVAFYIWGFLFYFFTLWQIQHLMDEWDLRDRRVFWLTNKRVKRMDDYRAFTIYDLWKTKTKKSAIRAQAKIRFKLWMYNSPPFPVLVEIAFIKLLLFWLLPVVIHLIHQIAHPLDFWDPSFIPAHQFTHPS